ncbi:hypothetical protein GW796_06820 [archaeon]|nr:hypothetical protein [archaeon]
MNKIICNLENEFEKKSVILFKEIQQSLKNMEVNIDEVNEELFEACN